MADKEVFVLSVDGGGIRGVIPSVVLVELERRLKKAGKNEPLHKYFKLIAGTSTGGIIAAGLTTAHPKDKKKPALDPEGLLDLYKDRGEAIFSRNIFRRIREAFADPRSIIQEKYDATVLEAELQKHLETAQISKAMTGVTVTAYDIERRETVVISNVKGKAGNKPDDYYVWQVARATSAAPTYFEPARVRNLTQDRVETLVDGGVFANDPGIVAFVEARKMGYSSDQITVMSIGTGYQTRSFEFKDARNWGPVNWINPAKGAPILSILMHGQAHAASYQLGMLLNAPNEKKRYFRFDTSLDIGNDDMDDASQTNIFALEQLGKRIIRKQSKDLDEIVERLGA